ncbi:MAG: DegT/DnrJ/EryC1/StrS family aminotransferase [bacterium]
MKRIPITGPSITEKEVEYVAQAAASGWYERANEYQERFERAFADYLGVRFAVALPSGTSAIHLALLASGIGPGDEVIVPDITWIASAAPISYVGATPVFADIAEKNWCISAATVEACLGPRTKAVIGVDLYGGIADWNGIREVTAGRGITLIEDAAQALGSKLGARPAGSLADIGAFSFHGTKTLTTGEGGMLVTDREEIYRSVLVLRDHGRAPGDRGFFNAEIAYKYKMSALQAALGLAQLERIDELLAIKRNIFSWYTEALRGLEGLVLNPEVPGVSSSYWLTTVLWDQRRHVTKEAVLEALRDRGIDGRPFFYPLSSLPAFAGRSEAEKAKERNEISYRLSPFGINLPSAMNLAREEANEVAVALREVLFR